jgi:hypothetical protein
MFIPDPDFYPPRIPYLGSLIPDPKIATRIIEVFNPKIVTKPTKIWDWDPGSRGRNGTGSRIRICDPCDHFLKL